MKNLSKENVVLMGLMLVAGLLLLWRTSVGMGTWGDEEYALSTALRYHLGDRPLVDSWDTNFSSALLALPFLRAFISLTGSLDGVLLAYRSVFLILSVVVSLTAGLVLNDFFGKRLAAVFTVLMLLYLPYLSPFVGYGADWLWHMLAAFIALRLYAKPPRYPILHAIPGMLSALGVLGNPPTMTVVLFFGFALWSAHRRRSAGDAWTAVGGYLGGGILVGLIFLAALRMLAGPAMFSLLHHVTAPDDHDFGLKYQAIRLWQGRWLWVLPLFAALAMRFFMPFLMRFFAPSETAKNSFLPEASAALGLCAALLAVKAHRIQLFMAPQAVLFIVALSLWVSLLLARRARLSPEQALLVLPAMGAGLGWFLGSNGGLYSAVLASPLILAAALMAVRPGAALTLVIAGLIATVGGIGLRYTPEGVTTSMTVRIQEGPFRGIFAAPSEAERYREMLRALRALPAVEGRTVFMERYPLGYLMSGSPPGTYSTWATSATSPRLNAYIASTGNVPARVVLTRFAADIRDGEFPVEVNLDGFANRFALVYQDQNLKVFDRRSK